MGKLRPGPRNLLSRVPEDPEAGVEREAPQRDEDEVFRQERDFSRQVLAAVVQLLRQGAISGGRAASGRGNEGSVELEPVAPPDGLRLVCQARLEERPEEEVARLVPREDPPGAIAPVRGRREPDDEDPRVWIAERRQRTRPVALAPEALRWRLRRELAPGDQARAAAAGDDVALDPSEAVRGAGSLQLRE